MEVLRNPHFRLFEELLKELLRRRHSLTMLVQQSTHHWKYHDGLLFLDVLFQDLLFQSFTLKYPPYTTFTAKLRSKRTHLTVGEMNISAKSKQKRA